MKDSDFAAIGLTIVFLLGFLLIVSAVISRPECSMSGCDKDAKDGSRYCYLHDMSYRSYGNPDYNDVYEDSQCRREVSSSNNSYYSTTSTNNNSPKKPSSSSSSSSAYESHEAYDEGYNNIYEDGDYDWERYNEDDDYATGVDDAIDEFGEDW